MIISWYLARRFLGYFLVVDLFLSFLVNFIEFFEKLVRVKNVHVTTIFHFLGLNFFPYFFYLLPVSMGLATCLLLREIKQRREWDTLRLLAFIPRRFFSFTLIMGLVVGLATLFVNEKYIVPLAFHSERFKQEKLKQNSNQKLVSKWLELEQNKICYFSLLDLSIMKGRDLLVIFMTPSFVLEKIIQVPFFTLDPVKNEIDVPEGKIFPIDGGEFEVKNMTLHSPMFFSQIRMIFQVPTLYKMIEKVILYKDLLPDGIYNEFLYECLVRFGFYMRIVLYPVLTFCFFMGMQHPVIRWVLALSPYILFSLFDVITGSMVNWNHLVYVVLLFYLVIILGVFICRLRLIR